jgi:D-sedoheptulose 7-phosphate isomerase
MSGRSMMRTAGTEDLGETAARLLATRTRANREFFAAHAERLARCCHRMAERFASGGRLVALGRSPVARSDARHIAVEFVHPVIVGKRALPAIGLAGEGGSLPAQVEAVIEPDDIVIAFGLDEDGSGVTAKALARARDTGCLTIAFGGSAAEWTFDPPAADPFVDQGLLAGRDARPIHDAGASSFLYPFLSEGETDLDKVVEDVRRSILMKAAEVGSLREQTLNENRAVLVGAALDLRERFEAGGKLLAFGNGGSATDAMDLVADLRHPARPGWSARRAIDLTEDTAILTAIANDIGVEEVFQRQVIAYGQDGDIAVALSTSGNSADIVEALVEARKRGLGTVAFVGYDGGRVAADDLADHVVITRSQHIPRIQEAQASGYHVLRELIEARPGDT